jgi:hypothetical protein
MKAGDICNGWELIAQTVKDYDPRHEHWQCRCRCGEIRVVRLSKIQSGRWQTCGCIHRTHGMPAEERVLLSTWHNMLRRCENPDDPGYQNYGGRGIGVCERWAESFRDFVADMGPRPSDAHSIDRIDNDGHYEPGNCRWATRHEQARNKRNNRNIMANGETLCVVAWADRLGCEPMVIWQRLASGWSEEQAVTEPIQPHVLRDDNPPAEMPPGGWKPLSLLTVRGNTKTVQAWAAEIGCSQMTLVSRLKRKWSAEAAIDKPFRKWRVAHGSPAW